MAVFPSQTLRDLIQNNIDYVAKQVGVINDFIFGPTSDGTDDIPQMPYILHTCQLFWASPESFGINLNWTQYAVANVDLDGTGLHIRCFDVLRSSYGNFPEMQQVDSDVLPYLKSYSYDATLQDMGVDYVFNNDQFITGSKDNGEVYPVYFDSVFNGINGHQQLQLALTPKQTYGYRGEICDAYNVASGFYSDRFYFQQVDNIDYPSRMIVFPTPQSIRTFQYIDNSTSQTINYNGDTIYNYYNDSGDIIINGGGIGAGGAVIAPVGGLAFADVKFILDSLVDDLNLHFDFGADGVAPLDYAPTLDEIRYSDQGDFYIEKLHQYEQLPLAPAFDGTIDLGDYPRVIGESANTYLSFLPASLSALLCAVFIISIILDNLRGRR